MSLFSFYDLGSFASTALWVLLDGLILVAAVLFFRTERRPHTVAMVLGSAINVLLNVWYLAELIVPGLATYGDDTLESAEGIWLIQMGIGVIGYGLMTYGIVTIALLHYRRSRQTGALDLRSDIHPPGD